MQCDNKGICDCLSNVTGSKCNECAPMHYGIFPGEGCRPCDCDPVGSISLACNDLTGQCSCKNHVTGRQCNECEPGYYNLTVNGCSGNVQLLNRYIAIKIWLDDSDGSALN